MGKHSVKPDGKPEVKPVVPKDQVEPVEKETSVKESDKPDKG